MKTILGVIGIVLAVLLLAVGLGALEAWIIMLLWNHAVCAIFASAPTLSFWLAWGVLILLNIIGSAFKSTVNVRK